MREHDPLARGLHSTAGGTEIAVRQQTGLRRRDETPEGDPDFWGDAEAGESLGRERVAHSGHRGEVTQEIETRFSDLATWVACGGRSQGLAGSLSGAADRGREGSEHCGASLLLSLRDSEAPMRLPPRLRQSTAYKPRGQSAQRPVWETAHHFIPMSATHV